MPTEMELILEQTQQGINHEVSVTPTKHGRMTKPYLSPRFTANCFNEGYLKMDVKINILHPQPSTSYQPQQKQKSKKSKKMIIEVPQLSDSTHDVADEHVTTTSNDPLLSGEDRLKLSELMKLCTQLQSRVLALETTKANQTLEIRSLKRRVKNLEKKASKKAHKLKRLYKIGFLTRVESSEDAGLGDQKDASKQGRMIIDLDANEGVALEVSTADPVTTGSEVVTTTGVEVSAAAITFQIYMDDITLSKALIDIKKSKPKAKGIVMQEPSERPTPTPIDSSQQSSKAKDKSKAKMIEPEKPLKRKDQIMIDEEDNKQAMIDANYELATRLQEEERGELTIEEKSKLFMELIDKRKKHFARLRAEKIRSKPPTKTQQRNQMCAYLKNMANYKHNQLKNKSFKEIQMLFNNTMQWIEAFVPIDTELVKGNEKAVEGKLKRCMEIITEDDDEVTIKATPLSSKSPIIVDYKIYKEERKHFFKIIRADGNSQNYLTFGKMFKNFNREDLEVLWSIVKARFKKTKLVDDINNLLFQALKTMFEHHVEMKVSTKDSQSSELETS
nr:hypothetical protein [Tanacetum cinerariifolium]